MITYCTWLPGAAWLHDQAALSWLVRWSYVGKACYATAAYRLRLGEVSAEESPRELQPGIAKAQLSSANTTGAQHLTPQAPHLQPSEWHARREIPSR